MATRTAPALGDVEEARRRLEGVAHVTPVLGSETLSRLAGREVWLKAENLQRTGSFKIRGAVNKIESLTDAERASGVVAASAGNHGQAVAWAARESRIRATVFMPRDSPMAKVEATRSYGGRVDLECETLEASFESAQAFAADTGATLLHPFDDDRVVAGQGTIGLELAEQLDGIETVVVPIGGGGLASGIAIALGELRPDVRVVGVQAAACAPLAGSEDYGFTIAEGIAVKKPGELTTSILRERLENVVTVTDEEISQAVLLLLERTKLLVEGAGAAAVAAIVAGRVEGTGRAVAIVSGGNIDPTLLISVLRHGLTLAGRSVVVRTRLADRPGELIKLLQLVAKERVNVLAVEHHREGMAVSVSETEVELTLGTRDEEHCDALLDALRSLGYPVERLR